MHKTEKFLKKLILSEKIAVLRVIDLILQGKFIDLDIKKLKGSADIYRVRKGDIRIIFQYPLHSNPKDIAILDICWRGDNTYADY